VYIVEIPIVLHVTLPAVEMMVRTQLYEAKTQYLARGAIKIANAA
jgi:hypothetical protein